jgi:hypothetical protein
MSGLASVGHMSFSPFAGYSELFRHIRLGDRMVATLGRLGFAFASPQEHPRCACLTIRSTGRLGEDAAFPDTFSASRRLTRR